MYTLIDFLINNKEMLKNQACLFSVHCKLASPNLIVYSLYYKLKLP